MQIYRSVECELLVKAEGLNILPTQCKFCQRCGQGRGYLDKLPGGWVKKIIPQKSGVSGGQTDVCLFAPDGTVIRQDLTL